MKIRTDFVTNSSSTSYITITVDTEKETIETEFVVDNGWGVFALEDYVDTYDYEKALCLAKNGADILRALDVLHEYITTWYDYDGKKDRDKILAISDIDTVKSVEITEINYPENIGEVEEWRHRYDFVPAKPRLTPDEPQFIIKNGVLIAFSCPNCQNIVIPDSVTEIGGGVFSSLQDSMVESIHIPNGVKTIREGAFLDSLELKGISIPDTVSVIENYAFCRSGLERVDIPNGIKTICDYTFFECRNLKELTIPNSVVEIKNGAFHRSGIEALSIPDSVTLIDSCAFSGCDKLKVVDIAGDPLFGKEVFRGCSLLADEGGYVVVKGILFDYVGSQKDLKIPDSIRKIDIGAFRMCKDFVESIDIPMSVEYIEGDVFAGCSQLKKIMIPNSVKNFKLTYEWSEGIHDYYCSSLDGCISLKTLVLPDSYEQLRKFEFEDFELETLVANVNSLKYSKQRVLAVLTYFRDPSLYTSELQIEELKKYFLSHKKDILEYVFEEDLVGAVCYLSEIGAITGKNYSSMYYEPASNVGAAKCIAFLKEWNENAPVSRA